MIGYTPAESALTGSVSGLPGAIALAEVSMYYDQHERGRPLLGDAVLNLKAAGTPADRKAHVEAVAAWLGVKLEFRNGTWFAQRRFGQAGESVIVEAHYTPDHDIAFAAVQQASENRAEDQDAQVTAA